MVRLLAGVTVMMATVAVGATLGAAPAAAGDPCPNGWVCLYRDRDGGGPSYFLEGGDRIQVLGSFNDRMSSWRNASGRRYCWYTDRDYKGYELPMPAYGADRVVNLTASENDTASSIRPC